jgi:hypothetical protein
MGEQPRRDGFLESQGHAANPVVHPDNAEHGVLNALTFETAVVEDPPGFHMGEDMLDVGSHLLVGPLCFFQSGRFRPAAFAVVRDRRVRFTGGRRR